jgi:hypothetical protein
VQEHLDRKVYMREVGPEAVSVESTRLIGREREIKELVLALLSVAQRVEEAVQHARVLRELEVVTVLVVQALTFQSLRERRRRPEQGLAQSVSVEQCRSRAPRPSARRATGRRRAARGSI